MSPSTQRRKGQRTTDCMMPLLVLSPTLLGSFRLPYIYYVRLGA